MNGLRMKMLGLLALAATASGCDEFPKDIAGTTEGVLARGAMRAGIVAGGPAVEERALVERLANSMSVDADIRDGATEDLIQRLNAGEIDVVVGEFAKSTPWSTRTAMTSSARAIAPPKDHPVLRALVRPGENRWLILVERTVRESQT